MRLYIQLSLALTHAGVGGCLLLSILLAAWETFTMYVLAKFAERYSSHSYGNLIRKALGKKLSGLLSAILVVYLWGSCVAYLVSELWGVHGQGVSNYRVKCCESQGADHTLLQTAIG